MVPQRQVTINGARGRGRKKFGFGASNSASPSPLGCNSARATIKPLGFSLRF